MIPQEVGSDIHPDGSRFVVTADQSETGQASPGELSEVYIVTNWFEELRERMGN